MTRYLRARPRREPPGWVDAGILVVLVAVAFCTLTVLAGVRW